MFHLWEECSIPGYVKLFRDNWLNKQNMEIKEKSSRMEAPGIVWLEEIEGADVFFGERFTAWQETSVLIYSSINTIDVVGNLLLL